jgi:hypothetical protein
MNLLLDIFALRNISKGSTNKFLDYSKSNFGDMTIIDINKMIPTALTPYTTCPINNRKYNFVASLVISLITPIPKSFR